VQGIAEFLPISSAAHMRTLPALLGWTDPGIPYPLAIQLGAAAAGLVYFVQYLLRPGAGTESRGENARLLSCVGVATVPVAVLGALVKKAIDTNLQSPWVMSSALVVLAVVMFVVERAAAERRTLDDVGFQDALWVGLWQALALVPGWSRSASIITGGLLRGLTREDAARLSIFLSVPASLLAGASAIGQLMRGSEPPSASLLAAGTAASFVSSFGAIALLLWMARTRTFVGFVVYGAAMGVSVAALHLMGSL